LPLSFDDVAVPATAVPTRAATTAARATSIAGDGVTRLNRFMESSFVVPARQGV
jgi:hypothetical protein